MPLPQALIDRLTEDKLYVPTTIDLGTYSELKRGVPTIGIPTVLLTSLPDDDDAAAAVKALIGEIERGKGLIEDHIEGVELDQLDRRRAAPRDRHSRGREETSRGRQPDGALGRSVRARPAGRRMHGATRVRSGEAWRPGRTCWC